jgi:DNA helicase-2/ATP-dependent DNA helicase PcrA
MTEVRENILNATRHILVTGGPGSGKTTIALQKASKLVSDNFLQLSQRILFLSFARSTIARVAEQALQVIENKDKDKIEINTYHGFAWKLIRSYGYLLNQKTIRLLLPSDAASRLSDIPKSDKSLRIPKKHHLFNEEGLLDFDLFALKANDILERSSKIGQIISNVYPFIILDEFQDTNSDEWNMIKSLGRQSTLFVLADLDQRIYDFRGAGPNRIKLFCEQYKPEIFDFSTENYRSSSTDIVKFGNDLLTETHKNEQYNDVHIIKYPCRRNGHWELKSQIFCAMNRQKKDTDDWSIAVLVPTKKLMVEVSDFLESKQKLCNGSSMPSVHHEVAVDWEGPTLAAELIAELLEGNKNKEQILQGIINCTINYLRGHKGDSPVKNELNLATGIESYITNGKSRGKKCNSLINDSIALARNRLQIQLSGSPEKDWLTIRNLMAELSSPVFQDIVNDSKYLRLLRKGTLLSSKLDEVWRKYNNYRDALQLVKNALLQEHFVARSNNYHGIHIMTMHKSKGKQFSEVILYEGSTQYHDRYVQNNNVNDERIRLFRVAVTRAIKRVTILTPDRFPTPILFSLK